MPKEIHSLKEEPTKSQWHIAKQSLTSMHGEAFDVVGRDEELATVESFIENCITAGAGATLYVAGAPGCGKSAVMQVIVKKYQQGVDRNGKPLPKMNTLFLNCLQLEGVEELRSCIKSKREESEPEKENQTKKRRGRPAKNKDTQTHTTVQWLLVIADELDQLRGISDCPIFDDPFIIFIGVSNRLDLSDKVSATPRRSSISTKRLSMAAPSFLVGRNVLNFKPYTAEQLIAIMQARIEQIKGAGNLFQMPALMFCAKRVAASSGDARQALDLARRAMDVAARRCGVSSEEFDPMQHNINVTVADVAQVVNAVFGSALNDVTVSTSSSNEASVSSGPGLPLHERLSLVAILNCINAMQSANESRMSIGGRTPGRKGKAESNTCPLMRAYATYTSQCRQHTIDPLSQSDFTDVCGRLADKRLLAIAPPPAKQPLSGPSISLRVTADEMKSFLEKHSLCNLMLTNIDEDA